ncbi:MAG: hypothetical protein HC938_07720 [Nitrospira sp.]|nr:hypothetical protein [Nitrospira sp.]
MKRRDTRQRKQTLAGLKTTAGIDWMLGTLVRVIHSGKQALDASKRNIRRWSSRRICRHIFESIGDD